MSSPTKEAATPRKTRNKPSISRTPRSVWKGDELGKNKVQKSITNYFSTTPIKSEVEERIKANVSIPKERCRNPLKPNSPACRLLFTAEPITISDDDEMEQSNMENYHLKTKTVGNKSKNRNISLSRKLHKTKSCDSIVSTKSVESDVAKPACSASTVTPSTNPEGSVTSSSSTSEIEPSNGCSPCKKFKKQSSTVALEPTSVRSVISYTNVSKNVSGFRNDAAESPDCQLPVSTGVESLSKSITGSTIPPEFCQDETVVVSSQEYSDDFGALVESVNAECSQLIFSGKESAGTESLAVTNEPRIQAKTEAELKLLAEAVDLANIDWSPMEEEVKLASPMKIPFMSVTTPQKCVPDKLFPTTPSKPSVDSGLAVSSSAGQTPKKLSPLKCSTLQKEPPKTPSKATASVSGPSTPVKKSPYRSPRKASPRKSPMKLDKEAVSGNVALEHCITECKRYAQLALRLNSTNQKVAADYLSLALPEKILLHKLLVRKWAWIRDIDMKYEKIVHNKSNSLDSLRDKGFLDVMSPCEHLRVILEQLKRPELEILCKQYKVESVGSKKDELVSRLCKFVSLQGGLGFTAKTLKTVMTNAAVGLLGKCVRIREDTRCILQKIFEASMCPVYLEGQFYSFQQRLSGLERLLNDVKFEGKKLIPFTLSDFQLFLSPSQFDEFITSVILKFEILAAKDEKNNARGVELASDARASLLIYLHNPLVKEFLNKTPRYIWRYTAGSNYTSALDVGIDFLKRSKQYDNAILAIDVLLAQGQFRKHCRGRWYAEKVMIMDKQLKKPAAEIYSVLMAGLQEDLTPIGRLELSKKAEGIINKKKSGLTPEEKKEIRKLITTPKLKHNTKEIRSTEAPNMSNGTRQTFVEFSACGERTYLNVEQVARNSYMDEFPEGMHDEGLFMKNIILVSFWPVIYMHKENMFVSRYQNAPLDWGTRAFYCNRQQDIQHHISRLREGGIDCVMQQITDVVTVYANHHSLISWFNISFDMLPTIKNILSCLTLDKFLKLADYLLESFRERRSGWPDLTLWNTVSGKFKLVEVKSPNDELSLKQIVWLEKFAEIGIDVEECRVNASNKGKKRKAQPASVPSDASQEIM